MFSLFVFVFSISFTRGHTPCALRYVESGTVCVCNATYCDTVPDLVELSEGEYQLYSTSSSNLGFTSKTAKFSLISWDSSITIKVNTNEQYQSMIGFGGAFTDSTGINILSLPEEAQEKLLESYFGSTGIGYNLCRVPIGGSDFSPRGYTYCDTEDHFLGNFSLQPEDFSYKIPLIERARNKRQNLPFRLIGTAWSAPAWMKNNNALNGYGWLKREYYQLWAEYYIKFFEAYEEQNITFWGLTTQNEPADGLYPDSLSTRNCMGWLPTWMNDWVAENLGPTLKSSKYEDIKLMIFEDQRTHLPLIYDIVIKNETVMQYVDGVALHYYYDFATPPYYLKFAKSPVKDLFILYTEACEGAILKELNNEKSIEWGSWLRGARYAKSIFEDIQYGSSGWLDWNMVLNETGGPSYLRNAVVDASVLVNATAGEFYKQPMFYVQGHFSKFVLPESVRIGTSINDTNGTASLLAEAFLRPDNLVALLINNREERDLEVQVDITGYTTILMLEALSINTILYQQ